MKTDINTVILVVIIALLLKDNCVAVQEAFAESHCNSELSGADKDCCVCMTSNWCDENYVGNCSACKNATGSATTIKNICEM
tara:strand:- start:741 stop:986 length:246 start_codon:yes stop_codon:yes gene_type:complete